MKMTFQTKHTKIFLIFFLILVLVLVFNLFVFTRSLMSDFFSPFLKGGDYFYKSFEFIPKLFYDKNKIITENKNLLNEIENNRLSLIDSESIKYENQKLRESLKIKPAGNFIATNIIARSPQIPLDTLFLDKGIGDGMSNDDLVLAGERILIGKIVKLSKNRATVALNSFARVISYGLVARTNEPLEIKGAGGGSIETKIPIDFDIVIGDKIMVGGSSNYLVAVVGSISEDRSSGFKNVLMSLPVNISKISMVFIEPSIKE